MLPMPKENIIVQSIVFDKWFYSEDIVWYIDLNHIKT